MMITNYDEHLSWQFHENSVLTRKNIEQPWQDAATKYMIFPSSDTIKFDDFKLVKNY